MRNIKLSIKYDGSRYKGWQKLGKTDMTIQTKIENVLSKMTGENIELIGSGRTDAGVHAICQVANFKTSTTMSLQSMLDYMYKYLPEDIVVFDIEEVNERFHSRYNAKSKKYVYKIWNDKYHNPFFRKYYEHIDKQLDIQLMRQGASFLIGEHDFSSFKSSKSQKKSSIRTIYSIDIQKEDCLIYITIHGNGFLHNMVRIIVGTLIEVGLSIKKPEDVKYILEKKDRSLAGPTASAKGLYLLDVEY
ncbi:tRNA pseudouridine38-40 synthase [Alkalithermobacter thermoalcaliphilus JW-YL-7 = DSM 7308]|uniref:tRNA pseudouridine synthase A n=1 Tax=Alkalithermobacter thermoalcaliphilus JW-YL-7 = DSM 7308 TaxID=1121328 RepID=A0A150FSS2_CLOPD|nr:tRNA pseudouridine synthase A [[Clostridium] paradoxum JW-YL-7 = DSM 7308]SHK41981.1 tRNA pseudouridine38-40 synthase [[Clostridium] paradoxum JW-YL-7 = DSM 7308]